MNAVQERKFFGLYQHERCGEVEILSILGIDFYTRLGNRIFLFGISWADNESN